MGTIQQVPIAKYELQYSKSIEVSFNQCKDHECFLPRLRGTRPLTNSQTQYQHVNSQKRRGEGKAQKINYLG